jgi:Na+/melibiose symporter-like transporter
MTSKVEYFKDALNTNNVIAYSIGHLPNDLIIMIWSSYSTIYLNKTIGLSDYNAGLVILMG